MPRYPFAAGSVQPVPPLNIEETKFWLHIMEEHALFIKSGLPVDRADMIEEAAAFEREFKVLRVRAEKNQNEKKFTELVTDAMGSLKEFISFNRLILDLSLTNKLGSALPPLFFDHLVREAEYFMALLTKLRSGEKLAVVKAWEADFWLRIMTEHTYFIDSRIDPSERSLLNVVRDYETEFENLSLQGRDYVSMLSHHSQEVAAFDRFLQDSGVATVRLRDFNRAILDMVVNNRVLSTITAIWADHIRREAEHFVLVLAMLEKGVIREDRKYFKNKPKPHAKHVPIIKAEVVQEYEEVANNVDIVDFCLDAEAEENEESIDDMELDYTPEREEREGHAGSKYVAEEQAVAAKASVTPHAEAVTEEFAEAYMTENEPAVVVTEEAPISANPVSKTKTPPVAANASPKFAPAGHKQPVSDEQEIDGDQTKTKSKYKWGAHWPRQLGKRKE